MSLLVSNLLTLNKHKWENILVTKKIAMCMKFSIILSSLVVSTKNVIFMKKKSWRRRKTWIQDSKKEKYNYIVLLWLRLCSNIPFKFLFLLSPKQSFYIPFSRQKREILCRYLEVSKIYILMAELYLHCQFNLLLSMLNIIDRVCQSVILAATQWGFIESCNNYSASWMIERE